MSDGGVANISEKIRYAILRWLGHVLRKTEETSKDRRSTRPENVEIENLMRRPQIEKRPKK